LDIGTPATGMWRRRGWPGRDPRRADDRVAHLV